MLTQPANHPTLLSRHTGPPSEAVWRLVPLMRIGIDTGGTFTDLVAFDPGRDALTFHKLDSTPDDPSRGIIEGVVALLERTGEKPSALELLVHGTTVATNVVLQRVGARVALITTAGFRDVLHIQRQDRPRMYDLRAHRARPLVDRELRLENAERIRFDGSVAEVLDVAQLDALVATLRECEVQAVAVGLLHSYANPEHELLVGRELHEQLPGVTVCLSHQVAGEAGEYERFSTCVMNAYVQPVIQRYLDRLETGLRKRGIVAPLFVMKSSGGVMSATAAGRRSVDTVMSGPAGGIVAGAALAEAAVAGTSGPDGQSAIREAPASRVLDDRVNLITADMGGTSFDVGVVEGGSVAVARDTEMGGLAISVPMLDIHSVGAGGGSIGWLDAGGALRVGPRSAGALPGPACYGRGGALPTITDANLVLGRLGESSLLDGGMTLDVEAARRAIHDHLSQHLEGSVEWAAEGMIRVVNAVMTAAIRTLTVERGLDPREFSLCPFGGAGPLHGAELAAELDITRTVVPLAPGVNSAVGLLMTNLREDRITTFVRRVSDTSAEELEGVFGLLEEEARARLSLSVAVNGSSNDPGARGTASVAGTVGGIRLSRTLGQRYLGQRYELPVAVDASRVDLARAVDSFHGAHARMYGYARENHPVEVSSAWVSAEVDLQPLRLPESSPARPGSQPAAIRQVYFDGGAASTPVYRREDLGSGAALTGPAIIEQLDSTTVLWPGQPLEVDRHGQLLIGPMEK